MTVTFILIILILSNGLAYLLATNKLLAKMVKKQERTNRRAIRVGEALLDRLVMRHGFTPISEAAKRVDSSEVLTAPFNPYQAQEAEWEAEDGRNVKAMFASMDEDERQDIIDEARRRSEH
jgi:hypothetical protein